MFNLESDDEIESGLFTAYLKTNNLDESFGFLGVMSNSDINCKHSFMAIEERRTFYISKSVDIDWDQDLIIFENDPFHALCFIQDYLMIFNNLRMCKLEILGNKIGFAIDVRNEERWRFRLDHIDGFIQHKHSNSFKSRRHVIDIIYALIRVIKDVALQNFLKDFSKLENKLMDLSDTEIYFKILSDNVEEARIHWRR